MAIEQEMGLYQQSLLWRLPVWGTALVSGSRLHKTRHQDQGEEHPRGVVCVGGGVSKFLRTFKRLYSTTGR